ncbi:MAG: hypothetical protein WBA12_14370, partial [Catalinimonas sp.]
ADLFHPAGGARAVPAALELERRGAAGYRAVVVVLKTGRDVLRLPVRYDEFERPTLDWPEALWGRRIVLWGMDHGTLRKLLRENQLLQHVELFDLMHFVEQYVHAPLPGLELTELIAYLDGSPDYEALLQRNGPFLSAEAHAEQRLTALVRVAGWLHKHLQALEVAPADARTP